MIIFSYVNIRFYNFSNLFFIACAKDFIVTPAGFEPATNRAEICHSIQLNYGAKMKAKILIF